MENYYEILEVSPNASPEIIEKAYKVLAKKYHPDANEEDKKQWAEEQFKKINKAYEILSNEDTKKEYDMQYKNQEENKMQDYNKLLNEIEILKTRLAYYENKENIWNKQEESKDTYSAMQNEESNENENYYQYENTNEQYSQENSYNNNVKKENFITRIGKNIIAIILTIIVILAVAGLLWVIPQTREYLQQIYNQNPVIKQIVDIFI